MIASISSAVILGVDGRPVSVEVHVSNGLPDAGLVVRPPFRSPHHEVSSVAPIGGGNAAMRSGEIDLAHTRVSHYSLTGVPATDWGR